MAAFWLRISVYVWTIELSMIPVGSNACRSSAWVRTIPSRAFSWYTQDSSYFSMKSRASRGRSRISCRTSSVRSSRSRYRVRLTVLLLLQPFDFLARRADGQPSDQCQSTALPEQDHGPLRHEPENPLDTGVTPSRKAGHSRNP